jgi:23S rRNA (uracil1939-C5)-methyltransferase
MKPGDLIPLTIEKPAAGGRMIARVEGQVVLVGGAIPGERVQARVERVGKGVVYAETTTIDERSPDRRDVAGDPLCGGCLYAHVAYPRQLVIKQQVIEDAFGRIGRMALPQPVTVAASPEDGYRMRARLHVRGQRLGFFREGTHEICDVRQTRQLLPATCDALDRLMAALGSLGLETVRDIELAENIDASDRAVHLNGVAPIDVAALARIAAADGFTGLSDRAGGRGRVYVTDTLAIGDYPPVSLRRHVLAFFQGNRFLLNQLVAHVVDQIPRGADVIDFYAGVGLFSVAAAVIRAARVTAVEGDRVSAADLIVNAAAVPDGPTVVHQSVEAFVQRLERIPDSTVVVDPPRTGMSREAMDGLVRAGARRLIYVSCDIATLARDARRLVDSGYTLARVDAFDMFPNTPHVETVAIFENLKMEAKSDQAVSSAGL